MYFCAARFRSTHLHNPGADPGGGGGASKPGAGGSLGSENPAFRPSLLIYSMYDSVKISKQTSAYPRSTISKPVRLNQRCCGWRPAYTDLAPLGSHRRSSSLALKTWGSLV